VAGYPLGATPPRGDAFCESVYGRAGGVPRALRGRHRASAVASRGASSARTGPPRFPSLLAEEAAALVPKAQASNAERASIIAAEQSGVAAAREAEEQKAGKASGPPNRTEAPAPRRSNSNRRIDTGFVADDGDNAPAGLCAVQAVLRDRLPSLAVIAGDKAAIFLPRGAVLFHGGHFSQREICLDKAYPPGVIVLGRYDLDGSVAVSELAPSAPASVPIMCLVLCEDQPVHASGHQG
jgi:hypothetical protein